MLEVLLSNICEVGIFHTTDRRCPYTVFQEGLLAELVSIFELCHDSDIHIDQHLIEHLVDFLGHLKSAVIHVEAHEELVAVLLYKSSRKFDLEFVSAIIKRDSMRFLYFEPVY